MLSGMIIAGIAAAAAGIQIRSGAFTVFAFVVAIGFGAVSAASGQTLSVIAMWSAGCLVVMETSYIASLFAIGIWFPSETASVADPAQERSE